MNLNNFTEPGCSLPLDLRFLPELQEYLNNGTVIEIGNTIERYRTDELSVASTIIRVVYDFKEGHRVFHRMRIYDKDNSVINEITKVYRDSFIQGKEEVKPHGDWIDPETMKPIHWD